MSDVIVIREDGSRDVGLRCDEPSMTKQSDAAACDINKIMAKYEKSGLLMHLNQNEPFYGDVSNVPDYQAALAVVQKSEEMFMSLPGDIRARFENDPAKYLAFVSDPANKELMGKMDMLAKAPVVEPRLADEVIEALKATGLVVASPKV